MASGEAKASIYVLSVEALAGPRNSQPDGRRYSLLVFARGDSESDAAEVAGRGLEALGWADREILRSGEITDPSAVPADLAGAMQRAETQGCAVIVYDEP